MVGPSGAGGVGPIRRQGERTVRQNSEGTHPMTNQRPTDPILLIGSIILFASILTWLLPAGRFERVRDSQTGRTLVVPGSYKLVPRNPLFALSLVAMVIGVKLGIQ